MAKEDFVREYESSEASSRMADAATTKANRKPMKDLREALVELKMQTEWVLQHCREDAVIHEALDGELALKMRAVADLALSTTTTETCRGWLTRNGRFERCSHPMWIALETADQCYFCRAAEAAASRTPSTVGVKTTLRPIGWSEKGGE